jgi:LPXTG-motif cell wall-anchored protein
VKSSKKFLIAAGAAALAVATAGAGAVSAASVPVTFTVESGELSISGLALPFPGGSSFSGTWDDETGALAGTLDIPDFELPASETVPIAIGVSIAQVGNATGNIAPGTGAGTLTVSLDVVLSAAPLIPDGCGIRGITIELSTSAVGGSPLNFSTGALGLGGAEFNVPAASGCGALEGVVNDALGLPTSETSITLSLQQDGFAPPTTDGTDGTDGGTGEVDTNGTLPPTGASDTTGSMAWAAALALLAGAGLVVATRRRADA